VQVAITVIFSCCIR